MKQKRKHGRKIISYMLTLAMVFSMLTGIMPGTSLIVKAAGTAIIMEDETLKKGGAEWNVTGTEWQRLLLLEDGNYQLQSDIYPIASIKVTGNVTIDLNGYGIIANYNKVQNTSVITIGDNASLTLIDSRAESDDAVHNYYIDADGLGHVGEPTDNTLETKTFNGGYITGGQGAYSNNVSGFTYSGKAGAGIIISSGGKLDMQGGTIIGNKVSATSDGSDEGGGVAVGKGGASFIMSGGSIIGNQSKGSGGGIYLTSDCTFKMTGGTIAYNTAGREGGGIYFNSNTVNFEMTNGKICNNKATKNGGGLCFGNGEPIVFNGGEISGNEAEKGGGMYLIGQNDTVEINNISITGNAATQYGGGIYNGETIYLNGGNITGNTAGVSGGGIYINGFIYLKGSIEINQNKVDDRNSNLTGTSPTNIRVFIQDGGLTNTQPIGIDPSINRISDSGSKSITEENLNQVFSCDDPAYEIYLNYNSINFREKPMSVTLIGGNNATITGSTSQTNLTDAMATVTYTANDGYYFAPFEDIVVNGVTAKRTSSTKVTVSGTPSADVTMTIPDAVEKTTSSVTTVPVAYTTLKYDGYEKELLETVGVADGGTIYYAVTDTEDAPAENAYSESVSKKINAGTYYIWYKVIGNESHKDTAPVTTPIEVTIAKADALSKESLSAAQKPSGEDKTYTGSDIELLTAPSSLPDGYTEVLYKLSGETEWKNTIPKKTALGTYTVNVKYTGNNYEDLELDGIVVKIDPVSKDELNSAIEVAQNYLGTIGESTDYTLVKSELSNAITEAQNIASKNEATASEVTTAINNLNLALDKAKYGVYKVEKKKDADALGQTDDSDACKNLINTAKESIDSKTYDESKTLDKNNEAIDKIIEKLQQDLTNQRAADAVANQINGLPSVDDVTISNETAINQARAAYNELTPAQKELVSQDTINKLEAAENKLADLKLDASKSDAKNNLATYRDDKDNTLYDQDGITALNAAKTAGDTAIENATTIEAVATALETAKNNIDAVKTKDQKAAANVETEINSLPDPTTITPDNADTYKEIINKAKKDYDDLTDAQENLVSSEAKQKLTDAKNALELALAKKAALSTLNAYRDAKENSLYDSDGVTALNEAKTDGDTAINDATTIDDVEAALQEATDKINAVDTKSQKDAKAALEADYNTKKNSGAYDQEGLNELEDAYDAAVEAINAATVSDTEAEPKENGAWKAEQTGETALGTVKTKAQKDQEAADAVKNMINNLPPIVEITEDDLDVVKAAKDAFEGLTDAQKELIDSDTKNKLDAATDALAEEIADAEKADDVEDIINGLPETGKITPDDENDIISARNAYEALTDNQKKKVDSDTLKKLENAEKALELAKAKEEAKDELSDYRDSIDENQYDEDGLKELDKAKTAGEKAIEKAATQEELEKALNDAKKALDDVKTKEEKDKEAADAVSKEISKLPESGKVAATDKDVIEKARKAYDALTDDQKKNVPDDVLKKLTDAEAAIKATPKETFTTTKASDEKTKDAKISGLDPSKKYQYSSDGGKTWKDVTGVKELDVMPGTYLLRYAGDNNSAPGAYVEVTVEAENKQEKTVDMYRLYNPNSGEHFYTANAAEKDNLVSLGWKYEGIGWKAPEKSNTPVYRVYNPNAGDHHFTRSTDERDRLVSLGWKYEGIGWYSDDAESVPLYRQYNPNAKSGTHNYTASKSENDWLVSLGWKGEGIGWYGVK